MKHTNMLQNIYLYLLAPKCRVRSGVVIGGSWLSYDSR